MFKRFQICAVLQFFLGTLLIITSGQIYLEDRDLGLLNVNLSDPVSYKIQGLVNQLNLQFCTIVEVGEGFCNLFVEFRSSLKSNVVYPDNVAEVFLGICQCSALRGWQYCSKQLQESRPQDCMFHEATENSSARVHRRLCDVTGMQRWNSGCNCSHEFAGQHLYPVTGFKTCFRSPLPESICSPRSVCGVAQCTTKTLFQVHMVQCDPNCKDRQPFCEEKNPKTTNYRTVSSEWSPWSKTVCNETSKFLESESLCINSDKKSPAFDCLGPGIYCCPASYPECKCEIFLSDVMKVKRILRSCGNQSLYVPKQIFEQTVDVGVVDQPILSDIESDEVPSSELLNTNNFTKSILRARRIVDVRNYSCEWESPTNCILSSDPNSDRIEGLRSHTQQKSDDLEPKSSDPWHEMKELGQQDQNVFHNVFNVSAVNPENLVVPSQSKNSDISQVGNNFDVMIKDNNHNSSTYLEKTTGWFNKDKLQPALPIKSHGKDKDNSLMPINITSVLKSYFGLKNSKSQFSQKKNDSASNIHQPEFGSIDKSNNAMNKPYILNKVSNNCQNDLDLESICSNDSVNRGCNLNGYPRNIYKTNFNQIDNNSSMFEDYNVNNFRQIHTNSGQIHKGSTFEGSFLNPHNFQPVHINTDQIYNESKFEGSNLNEYKNNIHGVHYSTDRIKNTSGFERYNSKESPNSFQVSRFSDLNHETNNSFLEKYGCREKQIFGKIYRIHSNSDTKQVNNRNTWDTDKFKNPNENVSYGYQILGNSDQTNNNNNTINAGYDKHESYLNDSFKGTKNVVNDVLHFGLDQINMNNGSVQKLHSSNRFLNSFHRQPNFNLGQLNKTHMNKEYILNNPFLNHNKNNYSSSFDFNGRNKTSNLNNNAVKNKLRDFTYAELNNKKRYLTVDVIRKHIFEFVSNFTNQTVCNRANLNCELKNNLALIYKSMPFLKEIIVNTSYEMPQMRAMSNVTSTLLEHNITQSYVSTNTSATTPLSSGIQVIEIDTNNLNEVYKNIKSPSVSGNYLINEFSGILSNNSSANGKNNISAKSSKNISYLNESHAFILPIHLGTININRGSNNTVKCKKKNK